MPNRHLHESQSRLEMQGASQWLGPRAWGAHARGTVFTRRRHRADAALRSVW